MMTTREEILSQIDELQQWFAAKPYGWYARATAEQRQTWDDREREQNRLVEALEWVG